MIGKACKFCSCAMCATPPSCPRSSRASTTFIRYELSKTWMAGTSPAMTISKAAHFADGLPFFGRHRLHGQPRVVDQHHRLQLRLGLDRVDRYGLRHRCDRFDVDHDPRLSGLRGRIGMRLADDLDDADDVLADIGMIEEGPVAFF